MLRCSTFCSIQDYISISYRPPGGSYGRTMSAKIAKPEDTLTVSLCPAAYAGEINKGFERIVEASQTSLDLAAQQNADILVAIGKALKSLPMADLTPLEMAGAAFEGYVTIQKTLLDMAMEQSNAVVEAIEVSGSDVSKASEEFSKLFRATLDRSTAAQNLVAEYATRQAKNMSEKTANKPNVAAETVQRAMDDAIAAQKQILQFAAKPLKATAKA